MQNNTINLKNLRVIDIFFSSFYSLDKSNNDSKENGERQYFSIEIVEVLIKHSAVRPYFVSLMIDQDTNGQTPFMCAIQVRAYTAAMHLWTGIEEYYKNLSCSYKFDKDMFFPDNSSLDDSPMFVLCYNDTCSFTWTGEELVNQDIFECKTCGLTGSLCCCTECAFTCHRNHDCK